MLNTLGPKKIEIHIGCASRFIYFLADNSANILHNYAIFGRRPQTIFVTNKYCPKQCSEISVTNIVDINIAIFHT